MMRTLLAAGLGLLTLLQAGCANTPNDQQTLVDRATLAVQEMATTPVSQDPRNLLQRARGVMICPQMFKAGFFFGGSGGACVLLARAGNGTWSYPAFFAMGSGSFGLQIGIQDSELVMLIMTDKGLGAVMDNQFKFGADASVAVATLGAGVQGSTTGALGADIVAFSEARGLYGGISLEGSIMGARTDWNRAYYGSDLASRQIVLDMQAVNPGADPLREVLTRYGSPVPPAPPPAPPPPLPMAAPPPPPPVPPPSAGPMPSTQLQPPPPVQQQTLTPPPGTTGH